MRRRDSTPLSSSGVRVFWWFREPEEIVGVQGGSESESGLKQDQKRYVKSALRIEGLAQRCAAHVHDGSIRI